MSSAGQAERSTVREAAVGNRWICERDKDADRALQNLRESQPLPNKPVIDVDARSTWTLEITQRVDEWADACRGSTEYTTDLPLPAQDESVFLALFEGLLLRVYHCTKLLPHETAMIRRSGLVPLSAKLVTERIDAATTAGTFTDAEADELHRGHVFATNQQQYREGQVCFVLSKQTLTHGCEPLLTTWGGEAICRSSGTRHLEARLLSIGVPTVVQATIDLFTGPEHLFFAALHKTFVGVALGLRDAGSDVFYRSAVPASQIERIIQPPDKDFAAFGLAGLQRG